MKLRLLVFTALVAAVCAVGAFIKVPVGIGSAALDSAPAMLSVVLLPPVFAGIASLIGHLASALYAGFPLGPFHFLIAVEMFVILWVFGKLHRSGSHVWKWVFVVVANGVIAPLPFYWLVSPAFYLGAVPALTITTILNVAIAVLAMPFVTRIFRRQAEVPN